MKESAYCVCVCIYILSKIIGYHKQILYKVMVVVCFTITNDEFFFVYSILRNNHNSKTSVSCMKRQ